MRPKRYTLWIICRHSNMLLCLRIIHNVCTKVALELCGYTATHITEQPPCMPKLPNHGDQIFIFSLQAKSVFYALCTHVRLFYTPATHTWADHDPVSYNYCHCWWPPASLTCCHSQNMCSWRFVIGSVSTQDTVNNIQLLITPLTKAFEQLIQLNGLSVWPSGWRLRASGFVHQQSEGPGTIPLLDTAN